MTRIEECPQCEAEVHHRWKGHERLHESYLYSVSRSITIESCIECDWEGEQITNYYTLWAWDFFKSWVRRKRRDFKYWLERKIKGYDRTASWSLNSYLIEHNYDAIMKALEVQYKQSENCGAVPGGYDMSPEEWQEKIKKMRFAFKYANFEEKYSDAFSEFYIKGDDTKWFFKDHRQEAQEGFELFGKYFRALWT